MRKRVAATRRERSAAPASPSRVVGDDRAGRRADGRRAAARERGARGRDVGVGRRRRRGRRPASRPRRSTARRRRAARRGWSGTSCTLRTTTASDCGPTTTAACVVTRASSWLVSCSRSSMRHRRGGEELGDAAPLGRGERAWRPRGGRRSSGSRGRWGPAGGRVRLGDVALALEHGHLVADRRAETPRSRGAA